MALYQVTWKIDVEAESPEQAAEVALETQRDPASIATVFEVEEVVDEGTTKGWWKVDLSPDPRLFSVDL